MKRTLLTVATAALLAACGSSSSSDKHLMFIGNGNAVAGAVFNGPHAGQTVRAALLDGATVLEIQKTTVAAAGTDPAFSFTFSPAIDTSKSYTVDYWIDSNFGLTAPAGQGECDPPANDHQWSVPIPAGQTSFTDLHRPLSTQDVCSTFTFALTFAGDSTFEGPHAGNAFTAGLVKGSDSKAEDLKTGTVAAAGSPAFSVTFDHTVVIGEPFTVKLWIDPNFPPGGTVGTCDPPAIDHQWSFDVPTAFASHPSTLTVTHNANNVTSVCSFFP
jgi:hypothetical protein